MLGDIVRPCSHADPLTSGCFRYTEAVVVRVSPFVLVSRGADMLWSCTERADFRVTGRASIATFIGCQKRITYGLKNRRVKRELSKARRRLAKV